MATGIPDDLTLMAGETQTCFGVTVSTDEVLEMDESFSITLNTTDPEVTVGRSELVVTITDTTGVLHSTPCFLF